MEKDINMKTADIKRLGLILAIQAEIDGMKAENGDRYANDLSPAYVRKDFDQKADEIRDIVYKNDDLL